MPGITLVFILVAAADAFERRDTGRLRRGSAQAESVIASNSSQDSLQALASGCKCSFSGLCSCVQALEFMNCMRDACESGACACQKHHYLYACHSMSAECPKTELKCGVADASCKKVPPMVTESSMELVADVEVMQKRMCTLEEAVADGWINGRLRIEELDPKIKERVETLQRRGIQPPKFGCSGVDGEKFQKFKADLTEQMEKEKQERQKGHTRKSRNKRQERDEREPFWANPWKGEKKLPETDAELAEAALDEGNAAMSKAHKLTKGGVTKGLPETDAKFAEAALDEGNAAMGETFKATHGVAKDAFAEGNAAASEAQKNTEGVTEKLNMNTLRLRLGNSLRLWNLSLLTELFSTLVLFGIAVILAWLYNKQRLGTKSFLAPKSMTIDSSLHVDFGVPFFGCFGDLKLFLFSCCCPCLRWADTLDRAGILRYWPAFVVFFSLYAFSTLTFGITGFVLVFVCFYYRQKLRMKYDVSPNPCQDFFAYLFCSPCAIVQEARVEANRAP